jgi:anti-sigma regulatory factor (Ser/Thr protein kinase)
VAYLRAFGCPDADYGAAELILGELLSNAGRYTPGPVCVVIDWNEVLPRAIVHDGGRGFSWIPSLPRDAAERGRGLFIVSALAIDVHVESSDDGCRVAVTLPIRRRVSDVGITRCPQGRSVDAAGICHEPRNSACAATYLRSSDDRAARKDRTS